MGEMNTVTSSNVRGYEYDESTKTLTVTFLNNSVYNYFAVPASVVEDTFVSPLNGSVGSALHRLVKSGFYQYLRID